MNGFLDSRLEHARILILDAQTTEDRDYAVRLVKRSVETLNDFLKEW